MEKTNVSVAMAAYNGKKYIKRQIETILSQLSEEDELVISVDPSEDGTKEFIIEQFQIEKRIKVFDGPGKGVIANYNNAVKNCINSIIFLSDQDDIWVEGKVERIVDIFRKNPEVNVVMHDAKIVDENENILEESFFKKRKSGCGILKNIYKNTYIGCCMAVSNKFIKKLIPFPKDVPMHDQWIGICGELMGKNILLNEPLIYYRRHGENVSGDSHADIKCMLIWRISLIRNLVMIFLRRK